MKKIFRSQAYRVILALAALSTSVLALEAGRRWK